MEGTQRGVTLFKGSDLRRMLNTVEPSTASGLKQEKLRLKAKSELRREKTLFLLVPSIRVSSSSSRE